MTNKLKTFKELYLESAFKFSRGKEMPAGGLDMVRNLTNKNNHTECRIYISKQMGATDLIDLYTMFLKIHDTYNYIVGNSVYDIIYNKVEPIFLKRVRTAFSNPEEIIRRL